MMLPLCTRVTWRLFAFQAQGVLDRLTDVALAAVLAHGLDADA
jgi:hypothetical protein